MSLGGVFLIACWTAFCLGVAIGHVWTLRRFRCGKCRRWLTSRCEGCGPKIVR